MRLSAPFPLAAVLLMSGLGLPPSTAFAQEDEEAKGGEIIVTAFRQRGSVPGAAVVEAELNEADIASYGASSIADLVDQLTPLTRTGRGRNGGAPVMLVNGRRISNPEEIRRFPPEAIQKVQVLPEEVALRYGYSADQRVVNFILKPQFTALTVQGVYGQSWHGDRSEPKFEAGYLRLFSRGRWALNGDYTHQTALLESDRNIVDSSGSTEAGRYRTLLPRSDQLRLSSLFSHEVGKALSLTLALRHDRTDTLALRGEDELSGDVREKDSRERISHAALTLDGNLARWQWTLTGNADWQRTRTLTGLAASAGPDRALSRLRTLDSDLNANGPLFALPAGDARLAWRVGVSDSQLTSDRTTSSTSTTDGLSRTENFVRASLDLPIAHAGSDVLPALGTLSTNLNGSLRRVSDFGTLKGYGYGLSWKPARSLDLSASLAREQAAPDMQALGNPLVITSGIPVYDFTRQETVLADVITGGNPALERETSRDLKFGATWQPPMAPGLALLANYYINRSTSPIAAFPILTPAIEAAFPDRVERDDHDRIVSIDQRSLNFASARDQSLRYGISFTKSFGKKGAPPATAMGGPRRNYGGGSAGHGGNSGPGFSYSPVSNDGGRWTLDLFHTVKLQDEIRPAAGQPVIDLLDGGATGSNGGSARHLVELNGSWMNKGLGFRVLAKYESGSHVTGDLAGSDLRFSDLFTLDLRVIFNLDAKQELIAQAPWLKGSRLRLRVTNLTGATRKVRDADGLVPLSYQPGYLDPRGRYIDLSFRKQF